MKKRTFDFENFIKTIKPTNWSLSNLVNWEKVNKNTELQKYNLNILNLFRNSNDLTDIKNKIDLIFENGNQKSFESLNILIAKRNVFDEEYISNNELKKFDWRNKDDVFNFIKESNLLNLFQNVNDLKDYVYGVEVGLDSNARKSRTGQYFEKTIRGILQEANVHFDEQTKKDFINKKFDFFFKLKNKKYLVECNFYNGGGSKINEVIKSYVELNNQVERNDYEFIWITDGRGIKTTKSQFLENWNKVNIMNSTQFKKFIYSVNNN